MSSEQKKIEGYNRLKELANKMADPSGNILVRHTPPKAGREQAADAIVAVGTITKKEFIDNGMKVFNC